MKEMMTLQKVQETARELGLEKEVARIVILAEDLQLRRLEKKEHTMTVGFRLTAWGTTKTIFKLGEDYESHNRDNKLLQVCLPFYTWKDKHSKDHEYWGDLNALRKKLLQRLDKYRLDNGGATRDVRLELAKGSIDVIVDAIRSIRREVQPHL